MKPIRLHLGEVNVDGRVLRADDDLSDLVDDIKVNGLKVPILVRGNGRLVDGLRRLKAVERSGTVTIQAYVTDSFDEMLDRLRDAGINSETLPRRLVEIYVALRIVHGERSYALRRQGRWQKEKRLPTDPPKIDFREVVRQALSLPNGTWLERAVRLYNAAAAGDSYAQQLVQQLDTGETTIGVAIHAIAKKNQLSGPVVKTKDQRHLLEVGIRNLNGVVRGLLQLGTPIQLPQEELKGHVEKLQQLRSQLYGLVSKINRELEKKEQ